MSSSSRIPSYCLHRPSGRAYVRLGGQQIYLGVHGSLESRTAYRRVVAEFIASGRRPPQRIGRGLTVGELLAAYAAHVRREHVRHDGRPSTEQDAIRQAVRPVRELYADTPAVEFGPLALAAVREEMIRRGWCRSNVNRQVLRVRAMFRWAVSYELLPGDRLHALTALRGLRPGRSSARESEPVRPIAESVVEAVLPHVASPVAAMVRLQQLTGCRPAEACGLRPIELDTAADVWVWRPARHKTEHVGAIRLIPLGPRAQAVLRPLLAGALDVEAPLFSPPKGRGSRGGEHYRVKCPGGRTGRRLGASYTTASYRRSIHRACDLAGVARWSPHRLRHSYGTVVRRRFGVEAAQLALGHRQLRATEIYAESDISTVVDIARRIG